MIQLSPDIPFSTQQALRGLEQRLNDLARTLGSQVTTSDLDILYKSLTEVITKATRKPNQLDFNDVVRGGEAHALGYAPDPGPGSATTTYLTSDGEFAPLMDGAVVSIQPGAGGTSLSQRTVEVHGSLAVTGALSAETVRARRILPAGVPSVTGSRGSNAALASLITALARIGLVKDDTSA